MKKDPCVISLDVEHPGDDGIIPYTDMVTVAVLSGDPGGYDGEFEQYLIDVLADWFDGARVRPSQQRTGEHHEDR
ncbi:MAG: hypothetical protein M9930_19975 [Anaerolineae bacterium]|nr:hypothetical protein [Anaerolineae bacterium]